jgi:UDP-glucose 4-epimerase
VVPDSIANPLAYYRNNTCNSRVLIESAVNCGVCDFIFSSTAAVYGNPGEAPVSEDAPTLPISPYGWSKLMTEIMLRDVGRAQGLRYAILRYFGCDRYYEEMLRPCLGLLKQAIQHGVDRGKIRNSSIIVDRPMARAVEHRGHRSEQCHRALGN